MKAQSREVLLAEQTTEKVKVARAHFEIMPSTAIETALEDNGIWLNDPLRAGAGLNTLIGKNDARAVVRVLLRRLDGNVERKRVARDTTGTETEANAIFHNLPAGGAKIAPFWIAELASRRIASSAAQQSEFRLALRLMVGPHSTDSGRALDDYLASLPEGSNGSASENLRANLGVNVLPTLRSLMPGASASAAEFASVLSSEDLWKSNSSQAIMGLNALLDKDEPLAFSIIVDRFDGWSQPNVGWVDTFEKPDEPYSLAEVVGRFDTPRAQRFLDWIAGRSAGKEPTFSQSARLRNSVAGCFGSRAALDAAVLSAAAKQPSSEDAARRVRLALGIRQP